MKGRREVVGGGKLRRGREKTRDEKEVGTKRTKKGEKNRGCEGADGGKEKDEGDEE